MKRGLHRRTATMSMLLGCCVIVISMIFAGIGYNRSFIVRASHQQDPVQEARAELEKAKAKEEAHPTKKAGMAVDRALAKYNAAVAMVNGNDKSDLDLGTESVTSVTPETEPNNTTATATPLALSLNCGMGSGSITIGDTDFWAITLPANCTVSALVDTGTTTGDPALVSTDSQLTLISSDGSTQIEFDDDDGTGTGGDTTIEATLNSNISGATITTAGTYFLKINGFSATTTNITIYRLLVVVRTIAPTPEVEANDTAATANPLITTPGTNGFASGSVTPAGDQDFYSVNLAAGSTLYVSLDNAPGHTPSSVAAGVDLDFSIIAPDGTTVLLNVDSDNTTFTGQALSEGAELKVNTAGIYYIRVWDIGGTSTGPYELAVCSDAGAGACTNPDVQAPSITCPANITAVTNQASCVSGGACQIVNFTATATDNCPGVTVVCNPPSGTCMPVGTTTVTCTATDASGNTATCSFTITTFDVCLQDDSNPNTVLLFNSTTGQYRFCCGGTIFTGTGTPFQKGCSITLQHASGDRRVQASVDKTQFKGFATLQSPVGVNKCSITDRDTRNNSCVCQ